MARYVCRSTGQPAGDEEGACAIRIILIKTGKSSKLAD